MKNHLKKLVPVAIFTGILVMSLKAQGVTTLDTIYTPVGYEDGDMSATVFIPDPSTSRGIGIILMRYYSATRLTARVWCDTLAARGFVAMTIDYPNYGALPMGVYPKPVRAFKIAVEFLRKNSSRFGISTNKIVALGQSSGAFILGQAVIWENDDGYFNTDPATNDAVDAAVLLYGLYDNFNLLPGSPTLMRNYFSPDSTLRGTKGQCISNVPNISTPVLLLHATGQTIETYHSQLLRDSLIARGKNVKLVGFNSSTHVFDIVADGPFTTLGLMAKDTVLRFVEQNLVTGAGITDQMSPMEFRLEQNYPNPFNPNTRIQFSVSRESGNSHQFTVLKIFDLLGREVVTLVNEELMPGSYSVTWHALGFSSGVYFYRLQGGGFAQTRKLIVIR